MICPDCEGKKQVHAHLNYGNGRGEWKDIDCFRCKGAGEVPEDQALWIVQGKLKRLDRVSREMSLREEAIRLGISPAQLSAMEHGMQPVPTAAEPYEPPAGVCPSPIGGTTTMEECRAAGQCGCSAEPQGAVHNEKS